MASLPPAIGATGTAATGKRKRFPALQQTGSRVYDADKMIFRDNSEFVTKLVNYQTNVLFTRPPQLGKTTLWSLAELLLSDTHTAPAGLESYPPDIIKNSWYVVRVSFGSISCHDGASTDEWEERAKVVNDQIRCQLGLGVHHFLFKHMDVKTSFDSLLGDKKMCNLSARELVSTLSLAIAGGGKRDDNTEPTLLFLVDEYDKPIRDILFDFIGGPKIKDVNRRMKAAFSQYVTFLDTVKAENMDDVVVLAWLTGITPVGLTLISGFRYEDCTFKPSMADAVGLLDSDVKRMVKAAMPTTKSFDEEQRDEVFATLKSQFNNLGFPHGSPLYHTGLMNNAMRKLQDSTYRNEWLSRLIEHPAVEEVPSSAFDVIKRSKTSELRAIVSRLVDEQSLTGYSVIRNMSLTSLLHQGDLGAAQYLTLLLHLGVVSVTMNEQEEVFKSTSSVYRTKHLEALNSALAMSIADLLKLKTKESMYGSGEGILTEFLHALSETRMAALVGWARSKKKNKILELQLQENIVEELYEVFKMMTTPVATTQEDKLPSGRSDITITTPDCKVVLELKKKDGSAGPTAKEWSDYHSQLRDYVKDHRLEETKKSGSRWVAGFVLVMYDKGNQYAVRKLTDDDN